jgi:hypothetical protein
VSGGGGRVGAGRRRAATEARFDVGIPCATEPRGEGARAAVRGEMCE